MKKTLNAATGGELQIFSSILNGLLSAIDSYAPSRMIEHDKIVAEAFELWDEVLKQDEARRQAISDEARQALKPGGTA